MTEHPDEIIEVATGHILIMQGEEGPLECLSLGDYGAEHNVHADFLGIKRDIDHVQHMELMPLTEKWVITISSQYGCSMGCSFCDVPKVGPGRNATVGDLVMQFDMARSLHPEVTHGRINLHYARMGEPTWNPAVLKSARSIRKTLTPPWGNFHFHPVVSTMMPKYNSDLERFLFEWMEMKVEADGDAGLQLSINSTDESERVHMFHGNALTLGSISGITRDLPVVGRKITLNFAVAEGYTIDAKKLRKYFDPAKFIVKLTPMHATTACQENLIRTPGEATTLVPYKAHEEALKAEGFDVLVFIASAAEDEGRITCGNAILSGTRPYGAGLPQ